MQLIKGAAAEVCRKQKDASGPAAFGLKVNGQIVRIELPDEGFDAAPSIQNGDNIIVAGKTEKGALSGLAYKNTTQVQDTYRLSERQDAIYAWFMFCFGAALLRFSWSDPFTGIEPFPMPQWLLIVIGGVSIFFGIIFLTSIAEKFEAALLVNSAALETIIGPAKVLQPKSPRRYPQVAVQGHNFFLEASGRFSVEDGDTLAITVEKTPTGPRALTYRNLTTSLNGKNSAATGHVWAIFFTLICIGFVAVAAFSRPFDDTGNIVPFMLGAGLIMLFVNLLIGNYYRWQFDREAYHRTQTAARKFAPNSKERAAYPGSG